MWKLSDALLAFAVIALVIGIVLMLCFILRDEDEKEENDRRNLHRATLLLLAGIGLTLMVIVFQRREAAAFVQSML